MIDQSVLNFAQLVYLGPVCIMTLTILVLILADVVIGLATKSKRGLGLSGSVLISMIGTFLAAVISVSWWHPRQMACSPLAPWKARASGLLFEILVSFFTIA